MWSGDVPSWKVGLCHLVTWLGVRKDVFPVGGKPSL